MTSKSAITGKPHIGEYHAKRNAAGNVVQENFIDWHSHIDTEITLARMTIWQFAYNAEEQRNIYTMILTVQNH